MFQNQFDYQKARELRDEGIQRAVDHADALAPAVAPKWSDTAYAFLLDYIEAHHKFTSEDIRVLAESMERVTEPTDKRAWGSVMRRASQAKLIERAGFTVAKDPKVHCNNIAVWRSRIVNQRSES